MEINSKYKDLKRIPQYINTFKELEVYKTSRTHREMYLKSKNTRIYSGNNNYKKVMFCCNSVADGVILRKQWVVKLDCGHLKNTKVSYTYKKYPYDTTFCQKCFNEKENS